MNAFWSLLKGIGAGLVAGILLPMIFFVFFREARKLWWDEAVPGIIIGMGAIWGIIVINWAIGMWDDIKGH